jgi:hypothetical protein
MWKITIIQNWDEIWESSFQEKWLTIMDESPDAHVFFHPALMKAWYTTYRFIRKMEPLFVYAQCGTSTLLFPLVRWRCNWKNAFQTLIVPMGFSDFDYHDPIVSHSIGTEVLQQFYRELFLLLNDYNTISWDGLHASFLPEFLPTVHEEICPYIAIDGFSSVNDYLEGLSKNVRKNYLRRRTNLEKEAQIQYIVCDDIAKYDSVKETIPIMLKYHAERWPRAYKAPDFHENIIKFGLESKILILYLIMAHEEVVAWRIAFAFKRKLMLYMPAFNPFFMNYSPGTLSLCFCIEDAINRNFVEIDQLRGGETYKQDWSDGNRPIYAIVKNNPILPTRVKSTILKWKSHFLKR